MDWTIYRHHCLLATSVVWFVPKPETQAVRGVGQWGDATLYVHVREACAAGRTALGGHRG